MASMADEIFLDKIFKNSSHDNLSSIINPLRAVVEKSQQCRTSSSQGGRENLTEKRQPVSEGISWEPCILSSHTAPETIAER